MKISVVFSSFDRLIDWLLDCSLDTLIDWLIDWYTDWLIDWLIDWLKSGTVIGFSCCIPGIYMLASTFFRLGNAFSYYGVVLMTTELLGAGDTCHVGSQSNLPKAECSLECRMLTTADYWDLLWTTIAEFPGLVHILFHFFGPRFFSLCFLFHFQPYL